MDRIGGPQLVDLGAAAFRVGLVPYGDVAVGEVVDVGVGHDVPFGRSRSGVRQRPSCVGRRTAIPRRESRTGGRGDTQER
ncbi:hypothetical protein GCM10022207_31140 [Streptomyces lannensis]|uniref:Alcohol dehydrogenase N-terminal domain-containing protein n=1 Tax=Streptomyces lannensis TaxID=766498 RepID=A0ABP7K3M2_9ACTN